MSPSAKVFDEIVEARRSVRVYDETAPFDEGAVRRSLERAVLAPNSSNLQTWSFYRVRSEEKKKEVARLCLNQSAARTARELVVVVCRGDRWRDNSRRILKEIRPSFSNPLSKRDKRAITYYKRDIPVLYTNDPFGFMSLFRYLVVLFKSWSRPFPRWTGRANSRIITHKSVALAAQTFMLSMKAEGYDTCPMEGFDEKRLKRFLKLPRKSEISMVIGLGVAAEGGIYSERFRFPNEEVIFDL